MDEFDQLNWRTRRRVILDFNPSMGSRHWIWQKYEGSPQALWYTSTYEDNPHLPDEQRRKIEQMRHEDPWKWKVYGLGKKGRPAHAIYEDVGTLESWPHMNGDKPQGPIGLDFGYNDPMSLCRVAVRDTVPKPTLDVWALLHESYLTTDDLIDRLPDLGVSRRDTIICDSAEPDRIEKLQREGYNAKGARKGQGSVKTGIDLMKSYAIRVGGPAASRAQQEFESYRWKVHAGTGEPMDEPASGNDHAPDAVRYAAITDLMLGQLHTESATYDRA